MNRRQRIIVSITGIFIVLLVLVGLTYGYFITRITGNNNSSSISLQIAKLELVYGNDDGYIIGDGEIIEPGKTFETKTFTVTNNGDATIDNYAVILDNVSTIYANEFKDENDNLIAAGTPTYFERPKDFEISIECISSKGGNTCEGYSGTLPLMESTLGENINYIVNGILLTNSIEVGETQTYNVVLEYVEAGVNQSADMNKKLQGKFNIIDANNTLDITGIVEDYSIRDSVVTNSTRRISQINSDGSYKIVGLETSVHSIKVGTITENEDGTYTEDLTEINKLSIVKGETSSVGETTYNGKTIKQITITDKSRTANVDLNENEITVDSEIEDLNPFKNVTLANAILSNGAQVLNATTNELEIDKTYEEKTQITKVSDGTDMTDAGIFTAPDDYGTSYYYRGPVKNNYINFAGFTWRIVRINGDGTIRLILDGTLDKTCVEYNADNTCKTYAGVLSQFNSNCCEEESVGYMYGYSGYEVNKCITKDEITKKYTIDSSTTYTTKETCEKAGGRWAGSYGQTRNININDSTIKTSIDTFYKTYIQNGTTKKYEKYLADTIFCNDKTIYGGSIGSNYHGDYFKAPARLEYSGMNKLITIAKPTLKCAEGESNTYSRFTVSENTTINRVKTNGDLTYPIALLSADELVMAGAWAGNGTKTNTSYYLYDAYVNGTSYGYWWTITPHSFYPFNDYNPLALTYNYFSYVTDSSLSSTLVGTVFNDDNGYMGVRPVINLKSDVVVIRGEGTFNKPYVIG